MRVCGVRVCGVVTCGGVQKWWNRVKLGGERKTGEDHQTTRALLLRARGIEMLSPQHRYCCNERASDEASTRVAVCSRRTRRMKNIEQCTTLNALRHTC